MGSILHDGLAQQIRASVQVADRVDHVRRGVLDPPSPL